MADSRLDPRPDHHHVRDAHTVKIWDAATSKELATLREHAENIMTVAFSPDGQRSLARSKDGLTIWTTPK